MGIIDKLKQQFKGNSKNEPVSEEIKYTYENFCNGSLKKDYYYETRKNENGLEKLKLVAFRDKCSLGNRVTSLNINSNIENVEGIDVYNGYVKWAHHEDFMALWRSQNQANLMYGDVSRTNKDMEEYNKIIHEVRFGEIDLNLFENNGDYRFCVKSLLEEKRVSERYIGESIIEGTKECGNYIGYVDKDQTGEFEYRPYINPIIGKAIHKLPDVQAKIELAKKQRDKANQIDIERKQKQVDELKIEIDNLKSKTSGSDNEVR